MYRFEDRLSALYPGNNNVRPKIRQQLQVLRDRGWLEFLGRGRYRVRGSGFDHEPHEPHERAHWLRARPAPRPLPPSP